MDSHDPPPRRRDAHEVHGSQVTTREIAGDRRMRQEGDPQALPDHVLGGLDVVQLDHASGRDAGSPEDRIGEAVVARGAVEQDERGVGELPDAGRVDTGERMVSRDHEDELVLVQQPDGDTRPDELADEADVKLVARDRIGDLLRVAGPDDQPHPAEPPDEARKDAGQDIGADRRGRPDRELARGPLGVLRHQVPPGLERPDRPLRVWQERPTGVRELHSTT